MRHNLYRAFSLFFFLTVLFGCKKDLNDAQIETGKPGKNTLTPYDFDWEVGDYMPAPSGTNILKPWASGSTMSFPLIFTTDIKKADGWELVYNTFSPSSFSDPAYFVLYNRYRGILRTYFYLTPGTSIPSSYVSHTLTQVTGTNIPVFSYTGSSAADFNVTTTDYNQIQQYRTSATGTWYAAEFEMAYDPQVGTKSASTNQLKWEVRSINVSDVTIGGTSQGGINGAIATPKPPSPNFFAGIVSGVFNMVGFKAVADMIIKDSGGIANATLAKLTEAATKGIDGEVKNTINGIFGGATAGSDFNKQYVNLTTDTKYNLSGSMTDSYVLHSPNLTIPGSSGQSSVTGYAPLYTNPLGVMTLSNAPTATMTFYDQSSQPWQPCRTYNRIFFNSNSYSIIWNTSVINSTTNGATIQNLKKEIISFENYYNPTNNADEGPWPTSTEYDGARPYLKSDLATSNIISFREYAICPSCDYFDAVPVSNFVENQNLPKHVLRISFDVVPNNGAPRVTIVKSFNIKLTSPINTVIL